MPKNISGGNKHKKAKNKRPTEDTEITTRIDKAEENQVYAKVLKREGTHLSVECSDGVTRRALIRGSMRKRVWMNPGDIILCELGTTGKDNDCITVKKYSVREANRLRNDGDIDFDVIDDEDDMNVEFNDNDNIVPQQPVSRLGLLPDSDEEPVSINHIRQQKKNTIVESEESEDVDIDDL